MDTLSTKLNPKKKILDPITGQYIDVPDTSDLSGEDEEFGATSPSSIPGPGPVQKSFGPVPNGDEYAKNIQDANPVKLTTDESGPMTYKNEKPKTLEESIRDSGNGEQAPSKEEATDYLKQANGLISDAMEFGQQSGYTKLAEQLQKAQQEARDLYNQKASRNEWAELAQLLAKSVTQIAAASAGNSSGAAYGSNMSGLNIPGIDYGSRTDRAFREMQESGNAAKDNARIGAEGLNAAAAERKLGLSERLGANQEAWRQDKADRELKARMAQEDKRNVMMDKYYSGKNELGKERLEEQQNKSNPQDQRAALAEQKQLAVKNQAASTVSALVDSLAQSDSKTRPAIIQKLDQEAGKADLPVELQQEISDLKKPKNFIQRMFSGGDNKEKITNLQNAIEKLKQSRQSRNMAPAPAMPASPAPESLSTEDQQALDWANSNPQDPRAVAIKQRLGR